MSPHQVNKPQLLHCPASMPLSCSGTNIDIDKMATQTLIYLNTLEEHASIIQGHHQHGNVYQCILDQKQALPLGTKWPLLDHMGQKKLWSKMEDILQCPAISIEDHFKTCFAATTFLCLQHNIISCLPYPKSLEVETRIDKLRQAKYTTQAHQFCSLVPRPPPTFQRPQLDLHQYDLFFHVHAIEVSSEGYQFAIQYENIRDPDHVSPEELKWMLENSSLVQ
ncbi:hypothetical protein V8B97DRAFT_2021305 [Scleroderma yunnanense]